MENALADFLRHSRVERRLAPLTCSAYERDVTACVRFLRAEGVGEWVAVRRPSCAASWRPDSPEARQVRSQLHHFGRTGDRR